MLGAEIAAEVQALFPVGQGRSELAAEQEVAASARPPADIGVRSFVARPS
jgi:hypothetical protein